MENNYTKGIAATLFYSPVVAIMGGWENFLKFFKVFYKKVLTFVRTYDII